MASGKGTRVLFVDDEPGIRETLPAILRSRGYEVVATATVREALEQITSGSFDVLIADLNIGSPGDGFTVVSAMRRSHPECVTLILTGYPAFETALQAIRSQVDEYLIKPAMPSTLVGLIGELLAERRPRKQMASRRVSELLRENSEEITRRTLEMMKAEPELAALHLSDEERTDHIPPMLQDVAASLESPTQNLSSSLLENARKHGEMRRRQGYSVAMMLLGTRLLTRAIYDVAQENLLSLNLSFLVVDLKRLSDCLGAQLQEASRAFEAPSMTRKGGG